MSFPPPKTIVGGIEKWSQLLWKTVCIGSSKKLKTDLPYPLAVPLLSLYLKEFLESNVSNIPMFIASLLTIGKKWKQHKCPSIDFKNVVYIYI